jgi:HK97 family phage prohead protease
MMKKQGYSQKSNALDFEVKDNSGKRLVKGYFASFDNTDAHNEVFTKGAFAKSINERGVNSQSNRKILHLAFHDMNRPIGNLKVLEEHTEGLYFESELGTHTDGEDAFRMYKEGIIREHSVGFMYVGDKMKELDGGVWELNEVKLFEGSMVGLGANSETPNLTAIKSLEQKEAVLERVAQQREQLFKMVAKGGDLIELQLRKLCFEYETLAKFNPTIAKSVKNDEPLKSKQNLFLNLSKL